MNLKHGKYSKNFINKCKCGKKINPFSKGCWECYQLKRIKNKKKYYCINCRKKLSGYRAKRCSFCSTKNKYKLGILNIIRKGEHLSKIIKQKISKTRIKLGIAKGKNNPMYKKGYKLKGKKNGMYGVHRFGKKSPGYIHGKAFEPYPPTWNKIRRYIRKKYNYKCIICHKKGNYVHHIDYDKKNCSENNLILLCHKHHSQSNGNRNYWYAYFTYLIENQFQDLADRAIKIGE